MVCTTELSGWRNRGKVAPQWCSDRQGGWRTRDLRWCHDDPGWSGSGMSGWHGGYTPVGVRDVRGPGGSDIPGVGYPRGPGGPGGVPRGPGGSGGGTPGVNGIIFFDREFQGFSRGR